MCLASELGPNVEQHKYQLIIGDDPSARLVALIVGDFIKRKYEADGLKAPMRVFVAGGFRRASRDRSEDIEQKETEEEVQKRIEQDKKNNKDFLANLSVYANKLKKRFKEKKVSALFVTEVLVGGGMTKRIVDIFKEAGIECDVASLEVHSNNFFEEGKNLFSGGGVQIDWHHTTWGTKKDNTSSDIYAIRERKKDGSFRSVSNRSRKGCKSLANLMVAKTFPEENLNK
ncbi:MAG: hypothetical protein Q8Q48_03660 [Candidatus Staskawiczbacteria bacterium]|nr:hypothetical protein [Candidatus Staskawiczbacteria bacterium]